MIASSECEKCNAPQACLVACPNNLVLDKIKTAICPPQSDTLDDPNCSLEILFPSDPPNETQQ